MKSANYEGFNDPIRNIPLDDEYAYIFVEHDQSAIPVHRLIEKIEMTGAKIIDSIPIREGRGGNRFVLFKLNIQDVREIVLDLSSLPLIRVQGYNSKSKVNPVKDV